MKAISFTTLAFVLLVGLFFSGCQSGPSDEQLINTTMYNWKQAFDAQDIDAIMVFYSEDFSSLEAPDREAMRGFWTEAKRLGFLDKVNLSLEGAQITITDDTAEFFIISEGGNEGMAFALKKEDKSTWRITASGRLDSRRPKVYYPQSQRSHTMKYLVLVHVDHEPHWLEAETLFEVDQLVANYEPATSSDIQGYTVLKIERVEHIWLNPNYHGKD